MDFHKLDKNEIFLLIGEDLEKVTSLILKQTCFCSVNFYIVEDAKIIESQCGYKCSCNEVLCWHIIKVIYDKEHAIDHVSTLNDF
ncbi:uncharacterized protein VNE69_03367 [Vairimorpha necatrix]|uniref:SWIM-type domain-containing protein n=1 Tax=Vairimorpha necatrix TaxID=6039 RepID=A0AAX4JB33_9MICR